MHIAINESGGVYLCVVGAVPYDSSSYVLYFIKHKNDMHAPAALQNPFRLFGFWTIKIKISKTATSFDDFFKIGY